MQKIFFTYLLLLLFCGRLMAQNNTNNTEIGFVISAQGNAVKAFLNQPNDSTEQVLTITKGKNGNLVIVNQNNRNELDLSRKYMLLSPQEVDLGISFSSRLVGTSMAQLQEIFSKADKGNTYYLYTIATPKDPKIAATVRVRRIFLCKVTIQ